MIRSKEIISVKQLLEKDNLAIPSYQRPYKWKSKNVNQLIDDIIENSSKSEYRLGTVITHAEGCVLNIVDGQQRVITLFLIALVLSEKYNTEIIPASRITFTNRVSMSNIKENLLLIKQRIDDIRDVKNFLFDHCKLVFIEIDKLEEAFQLFDSQNSRGKDLYPHDLLKAYHLRAMDGKDAKLSVVKQWEAHNSSNIASLFSDTLYISRSLMNDNRELYFTKEKIDEFKGIDLKKEPVFPFEKIYQIAKCSIDSFNSSDYSKLFRTKFSFPFQINQTIINGELFFEMIEHYINVKEKINKDFLSEENHLKSRIVKALNEYEGRYRTGDRYVRNLFETALITYYDKFGGFEIEKAIEKIFKWAYTLRMTKKAVYFESISKYVFDDAPIKMFKILRDAISPYAILNLTIPDIKVIEASKVDTIAPFFGGEKDD